MKLVLSICVLLLSFGAPAAELPDTIDRVKRSLVAVGTLEGKKRETPRMLGNGFVVAGGSHVVTTTGVVQARRGKKVRSDALMIFVPVAGKGVRAHAARVVRCDQDHGLCLLRFQSSALPSMRLGRDGDVKEGELLAYTGYPTAGASGLYPVTHRGIVSAISPNIVPPVSGKLLGADVLEKLSRPYNIYQLDARAFPGNAGSPLYEPGTGRVVGVMDSAFIKTTKELSVPGASAISYAIPVIYVRRLLDGAGLKY